MRVLLSIVLLVAAPAFAATTRFELTVNEMRSVELMGASAAWAIDASIVDVSAQGGKVMMFGRSAGTTKIVIVSITGQNAFDVVVTPRGGRVTPAKVPAHATAGVADLRYSSAAREIQSSVTITREEKARRTEISARVVHHAAEPSGDRARTSVSTASYRIFTPKREITLLDRDVDHSPLTLSHTPLRGIHYLDEHWRLHAGYTAYSTYRSFLIPVERTTVFGAGYAFHPSARSTVMPSLFTYRGAGTVLSMVYAYDEGRRLDHGLSFLAELACSRSAGDDKTCTMGGAAQLSYDSVRDRVRADLRYRPEDFAIAAAGNPRGFFGDASWSHAYGRGSSGALTFSATDVASSHIVTGAGDVDHRVSDRVSLTSGASWVSFDGTDTLTIPAGVRLDFAHGGIGALYRYTTRGHGARLFGRASLGRFYASASADRQQNTPTLDIIFAERPDLALALEELGIFATSPADVARALREHAILGELGYIEGVTVDLAPLRTQFGFEAAWLGASASRQQLRARLLHSVIEGVSTRTVTTIATLAYARRLTAAADFFASYSWWRTERRGSEARVQPFVEIGIRQRFDELPSLFTGTGTISGVVFADENLDGRSDGTGIAAEVQLNGSRIERTKADGSFAFEHVSRGSHHLVASVPGQPEAYFTTPSRVAVETGERVTFGVASTPARLFGTITSDSGAGLAGVRVLLQRGNRQAFATTTSDGTFALAAPPGEWQLSILTDSVPAGYSLGGTEAHPVMLDRAHPLRTAFVFRAHRSISGSGARPNASIEVRGAEEPIRADDQGRFSLRSLPAGAVTLIADGIEHQVVMPVEPSSVALDLTPETAPAVRTLVEGEHRDTMHGYVVAIGAFRVHANAVDAAARAKENGIHAVLDGSGALTLVLAGPYESRGKASAAAEQLTRAGLEAVVLSAK